jgi:hypothetical protein
MPPGLKARRNCLGLVSIWCGFGILCGFSINVNMDINIIEYRLYII